FRDIAGQRSKKELLVVDTRIPKKCRLHTRCIRRGCGLPRPRFCRTILTSRLTVSPEIEVPTMPTESDTSRRDFLKSTLPAGAVAGAAQLAFPTGAHAGGSDTIKVGLIGAGGRGSVAAVNVLRADKNIKLVAIADAFSDRLEEHLAIIQRDCPDK